jgi:hypothetical protein
VPDLGSNGQTGQDKSLELPEARFRQRTCRLLTIRHVGADSERLQARSGDNRKSRPFQRLSPEFEGSQKPATSRPRRNSHNRYSKLADPTLQERAEHIAEWIRLTRDKQSAQVADSASV